MHQLNWKTIMVILPLLALGLPAVTGAEGSLTQAASVQYRADGTPSKEVYSGYDLAVQDDTLTLNLKGNAEGNMGWVVENLDPALLRLDDRTVTQGTGEQTKLSVTRLHFTALKAGDAIFRIRQDKAAGAEELEAHVTINQEKQITSVRFTRPGAAGSTDASALKSLNSAREVSSQETHEGHLIRNGFTGEAYSDQMVLLHLDWGMTRKDVEKLAKKMDCRVQYYMPMLSMAALKLDKPVQDSREMRKILDRFNGTTGVIMADVDRIMLLE